METSELLRLFAEYDPVEHRAGYVSFYCPSCQDDYQSRRYARRQGFIYADSPNAMCSNVSKCGFSQKLRGGNEQEHRDNNESEGLVKAYEHPYWSTFLRQRRITPATADHFNLSICESGGRGLTVPGLLGKLVFQLRTQTGESCGQVGRSVSGEPRYYNNFTRDRDTFAGFGDYQYTPGDPLALVEGLTDVLAIHERGHHAIAALKNGFPEACLKIILGWKPSKYMLAMDGDKAGIDGNLKTLAYLGKHDPHTPVIVLEYPEGCKDPGDIHEKQMPMIWTDAGKWLLKHRPEETDVLEYLAEYFPERPDKIAELSRTSPEAVVGFLEARKESARTHATSGLIKRAIKAGAALLDQGKPEEAVKRLAISIPTRVKPITGDEMMARIAEYKLTGEVSYNNGLLRRVDDAYGGFKGLCLLGGAPGVGKTIMACQLGAGLLLSNPSLFCLFLSLELDEVEIGLNMEGGLRDAGTELSHIKDRLLLVRSLGAQLDNARGIYDLLKEKEKETGLQGFVIVDRIQLLPATGGTDLQRDEQRYDWVTELRNLIHPRPVLAISELAKVHWASGFLSIDAFKGSGRGGHAADQAMIITPLTDAQLSANVLESGIMISPRENFIQSTKELSEDEADAVARIKEILRINRKDYQILHIVKARNGYKTQISLTNRYGERAYSEGFR